ERRSPYPTRQRPEGSLLLSRRVATGEVGRGSHDTEDAAPDVRRHRGCCARVRTTPRIVRRTAHLGVAGVITKGYVPTASPPRGGGNRQAQKARARHSSTRGKPIVDSAIRETCTTPSDETRNSTTTRPPEPRCSRNPAS